MMQNFQPAIYLIKVCLGRFELQSIKKMRENGIGTFTVLSHAANYCVGISLQNKNGQPTAAQNSTDCPSTFTGSMKQRTHRSSV